MAELTGTRVGSAGGMEATMRTATRGDDRERASYLAPAPDQERARWRVVAAVEVSLDAVAVILDLAIPTIVILALMAVSLLIRRRGLSTMGFRRVRHIGRLAATMLALAVGWMLVDVGL